MDNIFDNMDSWTLIKIVGGLTVLISSVISFVAYFIKDYFINKWKSDYQKDIEVLKAESNKNNLILNNLTNSISNIYLSSNTKRVDSLEQVWTKMMEIKENQPYLTFMAYTILTKKEFLDLPNTTNKSTRISINEFKPEEYFEKHYKMLSEMTKIRPFIGENLWIIYYVYQAFLGRLNYLLQDGIENGKLKYWHDDTNFIPQMLGMVIKSDELSKLLVDNPTSFHNVLNFLEYKAINDITEQITGKKMTEESVKHALKLGRFAKNTVA